MCGKRYALLSRENKRFTSSRTLCAPVSRSSMRLHNVDPKVRTNAFIHIQCTVVREGIRTFTIENSYVYIVRVIRSILKFHRSTAVMIVLIKYETIVCFVRCFCERFYNGYSHELLYMHTRQTSFHFVLVVPFLFHVSFFFLFRLIFPACPRSYVATDA